MPLILVFIVSLLFGGAGAAGVLYLNRPSADSAEDDTKDKPEKPAGFTWLVKGGKQKEKEMP